MAEDQSRSEAISPPRRRRARAVLIGLAIVAALVLLVGVVVATPGDDEVETVAAGEPTTTSGSRPSTTRARPTTTTEAPTTTSTEAPPEPEPVPTTEVPPPAPTTTAASARPPAAPALPPVPKANAGPIPYFPPGGIEPFRGLGVWLDVLDWSPSYTGGRVSVTPSSVDHMADVGVQTIYIQTSRFNRAEDVIDPAVLDQFITRAHARGVRVVAWYMPTHEDQETDVRRLVAAANLPVDGVCVNIESTNQPDIELRNQRLLDLSYRLRQATTKSMSAVVIPPVVTELLNRSYWPDFPWRQLSGTYDVWMPMAYWSNRTPESGWRDGYRYIAENTTMIRSLTGRPDAAVHPVGGIADEVSVAEVDAMGLALVDTGAIGGSVYDYATTGDALWPSLRTFRR